MHFPYTLHYTLESMYVLKASKFYSCHSLSPLNYISIYHTSELYFNSTEEKQNGFCRYVVTKKVTLWSASYSACVVCTTTIIQLSVGESGGYLPPLQ